VDEFRRGIDGILGSGSAFCSHTKRKCPLAVSPGRKITVCPTISLPFPSPFPNLCRLCTRTYPPYLRSTYIVNRPVTLTLGLRSRNGRRQTYSYANFCCENGGGLWTIHTSWATGSVRLGAIARSGVDQFAPGACGARRPALEGSRRCM
jgi:hypothetical protein